MQANQYSSLIIEYNDEAQSYLKWKPTTDTLVYLPLETDLLDHSLSTKTVVNQNVTIQNGVANFNGNAALRIDNFQNYLNSFPFTVLFFAKPTAFWGSNWEAGIVSQKVDGPYRGRNINIQGNNKQFRVEILNGSGHSIFNGTQLNTNQWYSVCLTMSSSTCKLYVNGQFITSQSTAMNWSSTQLRIWDANRGNNTGTGTNAFTGNLSEIIIDKKEWTQNEYIEYYNKIKSKFWLN